jgi:AcrR family transcriptional regulator
LPYVTISAARRRLAVDERREQLLRLGLELFGQRSYDELSIDDIARAAGVSKGLLYHYFASKRDFYVAALRVAADELVAKTLERSFDDPSEELRAVLDHYIDYVERHAAAYIALFRGGIGFDAEVSAIVEATRERFLDRLLTRAALAAPAARARTAFRGYIGFVEAAVLDWVARRDLGRHELRELCVRMAEASARAASV